MITSIYFNNLNSYEDLGLTITDMVDIPVAKEEIEVNNGYIIKTGKYSNLELPITFRTKNLNGLLRYQDEIMSWLTDIKDNKLSFSFTPNKYYIVKNVVVENVSRDFHAYNTISVTFTLEPFKYDLYDEVITFTNNLEKIYYNGTVPGEMNVKIYGNGTIRFSVNDDMVQINSVKKYVELDSKYLLCLNEDKTSKSRDMIGGFPILTRGLNEIKWSGNLTKIEITPRTAYL